MNKTPVLEQAKAIAVLLPRLARHLFVDDDVTAELPVAQLRVCGVLHGGPRSMSALGRELGVSLSAMTQLADRLERAGLVKRTAVGTDRRIKRLQLTERGEKTMRERQNARTQRALAVLEQLSPEARTEVSAALEMLVHACDAADRHEAETELIGQQSD